MGEIAMSFSVTMPALGESVTEGTVTRWLKSEGDHVAVDEALLEVSTDKVDTEIPSPVAGIVQRIIVQIDQTVRVGAELAIIADSVEAVEPAAVTSPAPVVEEPQAVVTPPAPVSVPSVPAPVTSSASGTVLTIDVPVDSTVPVGARLATIGSADAAPVIAAPVVAAPVVAAPVVALSPDGAYVTPIVRKLASESGVDLSAVSGTGIGGRIRKEDVLAAAKPVAPVAPAPAAAKSSAPATPVVSSPLRGQTVKLTRLRKVIAARMVESLQVSAQLTTVVEVDVTKIARLRDRSKASFETREGVKLSFLPFFAVAVCEALKQHPVVNSSLDGDEITYHAAEHLGIAVETERGLLVPVIRDAGDLNIGAVARKIADVAERTRTNKINPDELGGGTFTITNTGSRGALFDTPIINQPQVAILGLGAVVKRPIVMKGEDGGETIAIRSMVYLALSYDHRIVDGADAAKFLVTLKGRLEEGRFEADLGL